MSEKHFSYQGNVNVASPLFKVKAGKITEIRFLMPALVITENGTEMVNVDLLHKEVYAGDKRWSSEREELFFALLESQTVLPEDTYIASDEDREEVEAVKQDFRKNYKEFVEDGGNIL